jgi:CubicO group peptidase (beta-lactamase class C family)
LYLQRGNWYGEQVLSEDWIDYTTTPSAVNPEYGGQVWLNTHQDYFAEQGIPADAYLFAGHHGQAVVIVPSRKLVVVRTGVFRSLDPSIVGELVEEVIAALPGS